MLYSLVRIEWMDACGGDDDWIFPSAYEAQHASPCETVGWIVQNDNEVIVLAQTIGDGLLSDDFQFTQTFVIPKGMITAIHKL